MTINNEGEYYKLIKTLLYEKRITQEEYNALENYVGGILDALHGLYDIEEEDLV